MHSEAYGSYRVCLSVSFHEQSIAPLTIPRIQCRKVCGVFSETAAFGSYGVTRAIWLHEQSIAPQTIPRIQRRIKVEKYVGWFFLKLLLSGVTAGNTSEKGNNLFRTSLPRAGPLVRCILKAQEITAKGVYRLPHAVYCCSSPVSDSPRAILTWRPQVNAY